MIQYSDRHIDVGLTGFAKSLENQGFIWDKLMPRIKTKKMSDKYWIYGEEKFKVPNAKRADKSESGGIEWSMSSTSFLCEPSALHTKISQRDRENADSPIRVEQDASRLVKEMVNLSIEKEVADQLTSTSNITNYSTMGSGTNLGYWDDYSDAESKPLEITDVAIKSIYDNTLKKANTIVIPWAIWLKLKHHPEVVDLIKYQEGLRIIQGVETLPTFNGLNCVYALAGYDSSKRGQTRSSFTNLWGNHVLIAYVDPNPGWYCDTLGVSFDYKGAVVAKWHENKLKCDIIEYEEQGLDHVIIDANCGYLLDNVLSA